MSTNKESETPLIDLAPKLFLTIKKAQNILERWRNSEENISDEELINELSSIINNKGLIKKMNQIK